MPTETWVQRRERAQRELRAARRAKLALGAVVLLAAVGVIGGGAALYNSTRTTERCTVDDKDRSIKVHSDGSGNTTSQTDYRIYTSDCGVFTVGDNPFLLKFNSADTYSAIHKGSTYDFDVIGWRNGWFSMFPNILSATRVAG